MYKLYLIIVPLAIISIYYLSFSDREQSLQKALDDAPATTAIKNENPSAKEPGVKPNLKNVRKPIMESVAKEIVNKKKQAHVTKLKESDEKILLEVSEEFNLNDDEKEMLREALDNADRAFEEFKKDEGWEYLDHDEETYGELLFPELVE